MDKNILLKYKHGEDWYDLNIAHESKDVFIQRPDGGVILCPMEIDLVGTFMGIDKVIAYWDKIIPEHFAPQKAGMFEDLRHKSKVVQEALADHEPDPPADAVKAEVDRYKALRRPNLPFEVLAEGFSYDEAKMRMVEHEARFRRPNWETRYSIIHCENPDRFVLCDIAGDPIRWNANDADLRAEDWQEILWV